MKFKIPLTVISFIALAAILIITYGCEKDDPAEKPSLTTAAVTEIAQTTAKSGGNITDDGGAPVNARGVVWSTSQEPNVTNNEGITNDGEGTGQFTSNLTGLQHETTYYVRAYASNSEGTSYGNQVSFSTEGIPLYNLTLEADPQEAGTVDGAGEYPEGEEVALTATAEEGYQFVNWTDGDDTEISDQENFEFTMPAEDVTLTANFFVSDGTTSTVNDIEGNIYKTVYIGGKKWMAENLKVTKYNDESEILTDITETEWEENEEGAYAVHPHEDEYGGIYGIDSEEEMIDAYGLLYNWYAVDDERGLCPAGWRVASKDDWDELVDYLVSEYELHNDGGNQDPEGVGNALKSCLQVHSPLGGECDVSKHPRWDSHGTQYGFDQFGFSALPISGEVAYNNFGILGNNAKWWLSDDADWAEIEAYVTLILGSSPYIMESSYFKTNRLPVRCIRD